MTWHDMEALQDDNKLFTIMTTIQGFLQQFSVKNSDLKTHLIDTKI
jgi:hypothetical protein